jgi:hypothetical protein
MTQEATIMETMMVMAVDGTGGSHAFSIMLDTGAGISILRKDSLPPGTQ